MASGNGWWSRLFSSSRDQRRAERKPSNDLTAYFWTGSKPVRHKIRDISETGMYLITEERWRPGTVLMMTLQSPDAENEAERVISVQSEAVRVGEDGVGMAFLLPKEEKQYFAAGREGADAKTLKHFLEHLWHRKHP